MAANLPQQRRQQHWQLQHWLLRWRWQCGSGSGGLHPNGRGSWARPGWGRRCAQALPLRLALHPCGLGFALAACVTPSRLRLCPRGLRYALAAHATRSRLGLQQQWRRRQWKWWRQMLALAACTTRSEAWALPLRLGFARFALAACATRCAICSTVASKHSNVFFSKIEYLEIFSNRNDVSQEVSNLQGCFSWSI